MTSLVCDQAHTRAIRLLAKTIHLTAFEMVMGIAVANYPAPCADGHSFAVDANGVILAMADESQGVTIASFDLSLIRKIRTEDRFRWQVG